MTDTPVDMLINGRVVQSSQGESVLAAIQRAGFAFNRRDLLGAPRAALCGMGICQECAVTINGVVGQLACLRRCQTAMRVDCDV
jgi:hypothetical protein